MQTSPEIAFFLWVNAGPQTPDLVLAFARFSTDVLPWLVPALALSLAVRSPAGRIACLRVAAGMALAWLVGHELRGLLQVPRPVSLGLGTQWVRHGAGNGFPSMHAAGAVALACGVQMACRQPVWKALAWASAVAVCWSRLCLGLHFPMDVMCGGLIGLVCARLAFGFAWRRPRPATPPQAVAGSEV